MKNKFLIQSITITAAFAAVILLYLLGKTVPDPRQNSATVQGTNQQVNDVDIKELETQYLSKLSSEEQQQLKQIDQNMYKDLADYFSSIDQYPLAAINANKYANEIGDFGAWNLSGDYYVRSYRETNDSTQSRFFLNEAVSSYQNSIKAKATIDTKMKLALLYTKAKGDIMPGVALLREIVQEEPTHLQANYELALLSIQSGQDEKAIERFNTIIASNPDFIEAYIYKAQLLLKNNKKPEALETIDQAISHSDNPEGLQVLQELRKSIKNN